MKTMFNLFSRSGAFFFLFALAISQGCKKDPPATVAPDPSGNTESKFDIRNNYTVVNLVADAISDEYPARIIDDNLVNAWGLSFGQSGGIWISSFAKGLTVIYDKNGNTLRRPIPISLRELGSVTRPTGQVVNITDAFRMPVSDMREGTLAGPPSRFIFATADGTIAAWFGGEGAVKVADRSAENAVYTGLAMAMNRGSWYLYATDFHNARIDVFDEQFNYVSTIRFSDPTIPVGFAPFNIELLGGKLFVTYAKQLAPANVIDQPGPGNGYVVMFNTDGTVVRRLASQGTLNSPWGLVIFKNNMGFGEDQRINDELDEENRAVLEGNPVILVGNFGDGRINAFDIRGNFLGQMKHNMMPIEIEGLWALSYPPQHNEAYKDVRNQLYFTAGPDGGTHGVFGYITMTKPKDAMK